MKKIVLLLAACANAREAKRIARQLVRKRLAACVNVVPRIESIYRWKGKMEEASEVLVIVKTTKARAAAAADEIKKLHSYELPSIERLEASVGGEVAAWLDESVNASVYRKSRKR
ncbi:MAG: divalent-cation tolerance protein CutA [Candidatus Micrarchaeota archaeon]